MQAAADREVGGREFTPSSQSAVAPLHTPMY